MKHQHIISTFLLLLTLGAGVEAADTAAVDGLQDSTQAEAAWVWTRSDGVWTQQGSKLVGTGSVGGAEQGYSVALSSDGNTAIVGGKSDNNGMGAAWVWIRSNGGWVQQGRKLVGTGSVSTAPNQGIHVALSSDGNTAIVGGYYDNSKTGETWLWKRSRGVWTQQGSKIDRPVVAGQVRQGQSVSFSSDGNTAIIGGYNDEGGLGAAWVYLRD